MSDSFQIAYTHGFWEGFDTIPVGSDAYNHYIGNKLMLIVGEVAEAHEAFRKGATTEEFTEEIADAVIRIADLCAALDLPLVEAIQLKSEKNRVRPYKHGKRF